MQNINQYKVSIDSSIRKVVKQMDIGGIGFCVCVDTDESVVGIISDGDFRRAILNGVKLEEPAEKIINQNFRFVNVGYDNSEIQKIFSTSVAQHIPVLDGGKLKDIITEEDYFGIIKKSVKGSLDNLVIIMAGGMGTRLDPFTRILPKPLIPIGQEPIIKVIMDEFGLFGMRDFYVTINDKAKMIRAYFHDHDLDYNIKFIQEEKPLGTAGALKLLKGYVKESFFVSNCDIIIRSNYSDILDFHLERKNAITLVGSMQHHTVPYGVCEIENGGDLVSIIEKPEFDYLTNTGLYIIDPGVLDLIPDNIYFNMTDLIEKVKQEGLPVGVYPISAKSWMDIGQWAEYKKTINELEL